MAFHDPTALAFLETALRVSAILPEPRLVKFEFRSRELEKSWEFEVPYFHADTPDAGVREAARNLVHLAEALAREAAKIDPEEEPAGG
jgi:hypothetical protein